MWFENTVKDDEGRGKWLREGGNGKEESITGGDEDVKIGSKISDGESSEIPESTMPTRGSSMEKKHESVKCIL